MKIVFISDTHSYIPQIDVPDGDVLVHCGDALSSGRMAEFATFCRDLRFLAPRFDHILYTPGNHDIIVEELPSMAREMLLAASPKIQMLLHEETTIDGVKFFGSPWVPKFMNWAFMYEKEDAKRIWANTPDEIDVFFNHGMPYGILDSIGYTLGIGEERVGCPELLKRLQEIKPKVYVGGHLHLEGGQRKKIGETLFVNAAICDMSYNPTHAPQVVTINRGYPIDIATGVGTTEWSVKEV